VFLVCKRNEGQRHNYDLQIYKRCPVKDKIILARCWWLIPVILTTWQAEMRKIVVQGQPKKIVLEITISEITRAK
jgi:hypothetical protein